MRGDRLEVRSGVAAPCGDVVRMDPQEDPRMRGPGHGGQRHHRAPAEALASLARIDDEPREFHLCFVVIDPQLAVGHKPPVAVQPEWLHPVFAAQALICPAGTGAAGWPHHMITSSRVLAQPETTSAESAGKGRKRTVMAANSFRGPRTIILL